MQVLLGQQVRVGLLGEEDPAAQRVRQVGPVPAQDELVQHVRKGQGNGAQDEPHDEHL